MSPILIFVIVVVVLFLWAAIKILKEYERGVIFRLGRVIKAKGPGLIILIPVWSSSLLEFFPSYWQKKFS